MRLEYGEFNILRRCAWRPSPLHGFGYHQGTDSVDRPVAGRHVGHTSPVDANLISPFLSFFNLDVGVGPGPELVPRRKPDGVQVPGITWLDSTCFNVFCLLQVVYNGRGDSIEALLKGPGRVMGSLLSITSHDSACPESGRGN